MITFQKQTYLTPFAAMFPKREWETKMYKKCYIFFIFNLLSFTTTTLHNERKKLGTTGNMAPQLFSFCASPRWCKQRWLGTQWCASRCCTRTSSSFSNPTSTIDISTDTNHISVVSFADDRVYHHGKFQHISHHHQTLSTCVVR